MTKKFTCFLSIVAMILTACNLSPDNTAQLWFYTYASGKVGDDSTLTPASYIYLQEGGEYTRDFGAFDYGHWKRKGNELLLTNAGNTTTTIPIKSERLNELQLIVDGAAINFDAQPSSFKSKENDPFVLYNNRWRVRPERKETEEQLRKRLKNHFQFWAAYFLWALDNQLATVDVRSTPTLIKIYGNGFGLKPYKDLPAEWQSCFYDSTDCQQANKIVKDIFDHHNIAWAHSDNKYKMFIGAFQQMERFVR